MASGAKSNCNPAATANLFSCDKGWGIATKWALNSWWIVREWKEWREKVVWQFPRRQKLNFSKVPQSFDVGQYNQNIPCTYKATHIPILSHSLTTNSATLFWSVNVGTTLMNNSMLSRSAITLMDSRMLSLSALHWWITACCQVGNTLMNSRMLSRSAIHWWITACCQGRHYIDG